MYQKLTIVGNVGGDPQMRYLPDGTPVVNLSLAANRSWKNSQTGERQQETTWYRVTFWNKAGETIAQYVKKGSKLLVEGRLNPDPETGGPRLFTRQDGSVGASYEVTAESFHFMGGGSGENTESDAEAEAEEEEDDIPF